MANKPTPLIGNQWLIKGNQWLIIPDIRLYFLGRIGIGIVSFDSDDSVWPFSGHDIFPTAEKIIRFFQAHHLISRFTTQQISICLHPKRNCLLPPGSNLELFASNSYHMQEKRLLAVFLQIPREKLSTFGQINPIGPQPSYKWSCNP